MTSSLTGMLPLVKLMPTTFSGNLTAIEVIPTSAPQDEATEALLQRIRGTAKDQVQSATGAKMYVGGALATSDDFTGVLQRNASVSSSERRR